jgi:hypothetical protein
MATPKMDFDLPPAAVVENVLTQVLPLPDLMLGGGVLLLVILLHAFSMRVITVSFLKRSARAQTHASLWRVELLFMSTVMALLCLHLAEVVVWTGALLFGGIVGDWSAALYFAANCYTALGEPFSLAPVWRILPPIMTISGVFTFAWTASVLVNFFSRYSDLRAAILARQ